jgi:hypothetical protein
MGDTSGVKRNAAGVLATPGGSVETFCGDSDMSDHIESAAFQHDLDDDQRGSMETLMAELEADAAYVAEMESRDAETLAGIMESDHLGRDDNGKDAAELTKLAPVTATCRPMPVQPFADLAGVFDKPVRPTIAARVAGHVASL